MIAVIGVLIDEFLGAGSGLIKAILGISPVQWLGLAVFTIAAVLTVAAIVAARRSNDGSDGES